MISRRLIFVAVIFAFIFGLSGATTLSFPSQQHEINPKLSSNTQNFIYGYMKMKSKDLSILRTVKRNPSNYLVTTGTPLEPSKIDSINDGIVENLREKIVDYSMQGIINLIDDTLQDLYDLHPICDHINKLYLHEGSGVSRTILHYAVITSNTDLIDFLVSFNGVNPNIRDSYGYSALEIASNEGLMDMMYYLISSFKTCVLVPFSGYATIVHYAAAKNRVDILRKVMDAKFYDFWSYSSEISPLEIALQTMNFNAAEFLIKYKAFASVRVITSIYCDALEQFQNEPKNLVANEIKSKHLHLLLLLISHFPEIVYLKLKNNSDFMSAAIEKRDAKLVATIFASGFQYSSDTSSYDIFLLALKHFDAEVIRLIEMHILLDP